ncbi:hypothetical protein JL720_15695 [Aureococcus anophagefferens]|nr:hypothetical protein JL720_15695 [Aureococcus anophagefferens]
MAPRSLSLPARSSAERQAELWSQSGQASSSTQLDDHASALAPPRAGDTAAASALLTATLAAPDAGGDLWAPLEAALALRPDGWAVADLGAKTERTYAETAARRRVGAWFLRAVPATRRASGSWRPTAPSRSRPTTPSPAGRASSR